MGKLKPAEVRKCLESTVQNASKIREPEFLPSIAGIEIAEIEYGFHGKPNMRSCYIIKGSVYAQPTYCRDRTDLLKKLSEQPEEKTSVFSNENFPQVVISVLILALIGFAIYFVAVHATTTNSSSIFQNILNSIAGLIGVFIGLIGGKRL